MHGNYKCLGEIRLKTQHAFSKYLFSFISLHENMQFAIFCGKIGPWDSTAEVQEPSKVTKSQTA